MRRDKYYSPELKKRIVRDIKAEGNVAAISRRYGVNRGSLYRWLAEDQADVLGNEGSPIGAAEVDRILKKMAKMEQLLGEKELEIQILRDLLKKKNPT